MNPNLIVIGNGMVGHKFLERACEAGLNREYNIVTFCEEPRAAYDRVGMSGFFAGKTAADLMMSGDSFFDDNNIELHLGDRATRIDRKRKVVVSSRGLEIPYEKIVLATGSYPFVPPIPGGDQDGTFVYRTICDLEKIRDYAQNCKIGAVVGGGLLGLECANALKNLGLETHVIEFAPRLMSVQLDEAGGKLLKNKIEDLGVGVHLEKATTEIEGEDNRVRRMKFKDGSELETDMIVFSAGIRPRDDIARECGLQVGERGGITVDNRCVTSDEDILAIGECALWGGRIFGLVAPGYAMASVALDTLRGGPARFEGADMSTKLKLMGVDVASFGDAFGKTEGAQDIVFTDIRTGVYKKLVIGDNKILGGILVGDASAYGTLLSMTQSEAALPPHPEDLILPQREGGSKSVGGVTTLPDAAQICSCESVTKGAICSAIKDNAICDVAQIKKCTKAGTGCGGCVPLLTDLLKYELMKSGVALNNHICEHFDFSRQELFDLARVHNYRHFDELIKKHGRGLGCEVCKPAVGSILASLHNEHILKPAHAPLQDTNDRFLANIQRDGTYSVVPRIPGGEITPHKLIVIGEIARDFGLYTKLTGGQRIDLFGAQLHQLPQIWQRLIEAGMESGHAYGKSLRTVKSCVGSTWCRYGVQDSTTLAIKIEERYRGLRSPHKLKSAVSGCTRECAEAQSKDFGIIATERGWNLYVCGNGGMKPQHAVLLAGDLDEATLIRSIDRFLMFYIRTADRLQRTSTWLNALDGGIDYLRDVVMNDSLGIGAELETAMEAHVSTYACEWKEALENEAMLERFSHFVNSEEADNNVIFMSERDQLRPAFAHERTTIQNFIPLESVSVAA
ncbi:MAG TPA: nitrite reductase large subunit NirB [Abditibacteriaceae bacterium]|jgi:nitrite reductase (NADH) large subunit